MSRQDQPGLLAGTCSRNHRTYPPHRRCPTCGEPQTGTIDLSDSEATVLTWTVSQATPPGVRQPNPLAIVEFEDSLRAIGGLTTTEVETGDLVQPVYVDELRDPDADIIREPTSIAWDGYRFEPI